MKLLAQSNAIKGYTGPTKRHTARNLCIVALAFLADHRSAEIERQEWRAVE